LPRRSAPPSRPPPPTSPHPQPRAGEFRQLSEDLGAAFAYKGVTPARPLGITGFDIGVEVTTTRMENSSILQLRGRRRPVGLVDPKLHAHKGLWGGSTSARSSGRSGHRRDALWRGAALRDPERRHRHARRGRAPVGSKGDGTGDLRIATAALDMTISKKFTLVTPYAGAGTVRVQSSVRNTALAEESFNKARVFAGVNVNLLAANLALEAEKMGDNTSISAKLGFRF
jgi:hypothetical protein